MIATARVWGRNCGFQSGEGRSYHFPNEARGGYRGERMGQQRFEVVSPFVPTGDQPTAIDALEARLRAGERYACLLGATGTGKTFTMAHLIQRLQKPTLVLSHNKTLAAQLFEEFKELFPHNSVNYFVSYYDYYQPEAYIPQRDIYIEKDAGKNDELDQLRLAATSNILSRRDTIVVASVSCIFGLGSPDAYGNKVLTITRGDRLDRREFMLALNDMQYKRADIEFQRGMFRVRGDTIDVFPAYEQFAVRISLFGDEIEKVELINPTSGELLAEESQFFLFPAVHYVMPEDQMKAALDGIRLELDERVMQLRGGGHLIEAQRLLGRTKYDLEMMEEVGFCSGIENYSRYMDGRMPGEPPYTLMDYFDFAPAEGSGGAPGANVRHVSELPANVRPTSEEARKLRPNSRDWLMIIDESHVTLPQVRAMFNGDRARKEILVNHGFRLPSALDNRPLRFEEFENFVPRTVFVSATPGPYELAKAEGDVAEQVIRPTGLVDPEIEVKPADGQVPDLLERCAERVALGERVLVIALTKRLCEDLAGYLDEKGIAARYLHSDITTLERSEILTDLRKGEYSVLVGVNLLREGLDLPEVSLVCILDADKEGFLRSPTSLIQQMGRAARNVNSKVILYADKMTAAMRTAMEETERRRAKQLAYNAEHGITPRTVEKAIRRGIELELRARRTAREVIGATDEAFDAEELVRELEGEMLAAAEKTEFERAAQLRDQIRLVREGKVGAEGKVRRSELTKRTGKRAQGKSAGMPGVSAKKRKKR